MYAEHGNRYLSYREVYVKIEPAVYNTIPRLPVDAIAMCLVSKTRMCSQPGRVQNYQPFLLNSCTLLTTFWKPAANRRLHLSDFNLFLFSPGRS